MKTIEHPTREGDDPTATAAPSPRQKALARLLDPEQIVVFDGAMGTMLYAKGVFINQCYDELSLRAPDLVREVHAAYVKAGAEVVETNSFGANRIKLAQYGLESQVQEINKRAAQLAREAAGEKRLVAGAVGPLGVRLEPYGPTGKDEAREMFPAIEGLPNGINLFSLHAADGTPIALTDTRQAALSHAMEDELAIASVH